MPLTFARRILSRMALIKWSVKYQTGVDEVDTQHQQIVIYINELDDVIQAGSSQDAVAGILSRLTDYAKYHFTFEEGLLEDLGYADLETHRERHQEFIELIEGMVEDVDNGKNTIGDMLMVFLKNWLAKHILIDDMHALSAPNRLLG